MMHTSHIHVRTPTNPLQTAHVDPGDSDERDHEPASEASDYKSFASSSTATSTSSSAHTAFSPERQYPSSTAESSFLSDRDRGVSDFGTPIVISIPGSPHVLSLQRPSSSTSYPSSSSSSDNGQEPNPIPYQTPFDQPLDLDLASGPPSFVSSSLAAQPDMSTRSDADFDRDRGLADPNSPTIKTTTNTLPHLPTDAAPPPTFQQPPSPSMYTMPPGPTTAPVPPPPQTTAAAPSMPGIASLFPSALGLMSGAPSSDWSAAQQQQQYQAQPPSSYYYTSQPQPMRAPKVYGPLGTYEQLLDNMVGAAWSVVRSGWAMATTAASWITSPLKNVVWYYVGMAIDTVSLYWRASPHLRVFVYAFGLITAIPLAIFAGYATITLGVTLAIASGGTLLASGAALGGGMLVLGPVLFFSLIGAGLLTLAVSVLSGGWHALFGGGGESPAVQQQQLQQMGYAQPQQQQGLMGTVLGWLTPSAPAPTTMAVPAGYEGMLKQPPGTFAGAAGMQMQQQPDVLAR